MEMNNTAGESKKSRSRDLVMNVNNSNEETKGRIERTIRSRIVVPESVRQSFDDLVARTWPPLHSLAMRARLRVPRLSHIAVTRSEDQVEVQVELPGVEPGDVQVTLHGPTLTIRSARQRERESRARNHYRLDRYREVFERSIPLDVPVDTEKASAMLKFGMLQVRLPKDKGGGSGKENAQIAVRAS